MKYSDDVKALAQLLFSRKMLDEDIDDYLAFMRQSGDFNKEKKQQIIDDISDVVLRQPELKKILQAGNTAQLQPSERKFVPASELKDVKNNWKFLPAGPGDIDCYIAAVESNIRDLVYSFCKKKGFLLENKNDFDINLNIAEHTTVYTPYISLTRRNAILLRNLVTGTLHSAFSVSDSDCWNSPYITMHQDMGGFSDNYDKIPIENSFVELPKLSSDADVCFYPSYALDIEFSVDDLFVQYPKLKIPENIKKPFVTEPVYIKKLFTGSFDKPVKARYECFMNAKKGVIKCSQKNISDLIFSFEGVKFDDKPNKNNLAFPFDNADVYANSAGLDRRSKAYILLTTAAGCLAGGLMSRVFDPSVSKTIIASIMGSLVGAGVAFATRNCVSSEENQKLKYLMSVNAALKQSKKLYVPFNVNQI